jgi:phosphoribosylformylglycinamidine (FGAM) synthase-like amidotransferase family enzyme
MKFGVVIFPGSNCDRDMIDALQSDLGQEVISLWHKDRDLSMFNTSDCMVLPGGFSFGDYLRCGAIARFSPMMQSVIEFANKGGKVFGVCNGFQILCESGLLPGVLLQNSQLKKTTRYFTVIAMKKARYTLIILPMVQYTVSRELPI